ncbi:MAG: 2,3-bisphosphoglycerate-independent phosphoglycerate mutase [Chloroflexota bacterium]|nr:2,3-bisphosphoglycerate-independent phosphoglycerate mutase [Chloroflexota bacterium]
MPVPKPVVLIILDGWGINPNPRANAVAQAHTPTMDALYATCPHTQLDASAGEVGLPDGQMGNSEVGHQNMGAGFVVYQELTRLDKAVADGSFYDNPVLRGACDHVRERGSTLHLFGLLGPGGVHSHWAHLYALLELAKRQGISNVVYQAFTDGRDTPPQSGAGFMATALARMAEIGVGRVGTVSGRYYAMDRDNRWDRVAQAYHAIVDGQGRHAESAVAAIQLSYADGVTDEFVLPTLVDGPTPAPPLRDGDAVVYFNFRSDRGRELTKAVVLDEFAGFERGRKLADLYFATLTNYEAGLPVQVAFGPMAVEEPLAKVLSDHGLRQYHSAETEKYAHVTFFFNGRQETPYPGEDRVLVPSPKVATYDLQPEMSAIPLTDALLEHIQSGVYSFMVVNYANGDMVGHSGILSAAIKAVETIDTCLARVVPAVLAAGGVVLITADHGNCEQLEDYATGEPHTYHTLNPVPFLLVAPADSPLRQATLRPGRLCDVTPTILDLLDLAPAPEMACGSLIVKRET